MTLKKLKKIKTSSFKKTMTKGFSLTDKDLENIKIIKDRLLSEKISLTDSAIVRASLELSAKINKDSLIKAAHQIESISLGRPKGS